MKKIVFPVLCLVFILSKYVGCGSPHLSSQSVDSEMETYGQIEKKELSLINGKYYFDIFVEVSTELDGVTSTFGSARVISDSQKLLVRSQNSRSCELVLGWLTPGSNGATSFGLNNYSAGPLTINSEDIITPNGGNFYDLLGATVYKGALNTFAFAGEIQEIHSNLDGPQEISNQNSQASEDLVIPSLSFDLAVGEPGELELDGRSLGNRISLNQIPNVTWIPVGNLFESTEDQLTYANQEVWIAALDANGETLGTLICQLSGAESSLAEILSDEGINVKQVIQDLDGFAESVKFEVKQNYYFGKVIDDKGGVSAKTLRTKTFSLKLD